MIYEEVRFHEIISSRETLLLHNESFIVGEEDRLDCRSNMQAAFFLLQFIVFSLVDYSLYVVFAALTNIQSYFLKHLTTSANPLPTHRISATPICHIISSYNPSTQRPAAWDN